MSKNRLIFVGLSVLVIAFAWFAPASSLASSLATAVPIPAELNAWIAGLIFAAVTAGFAFLFSYIGLDLREFATPISGALSLFLLGTLQGWVNLIPAQYDAFVTILFNVLVVILSGVGTLFVANKLAGKGNQLI